MTLFQHKASAARIIAALAFSLLMPYSSIAEIGAPYGPQVTFRTQKILPPSAVYVGPDDSIAVFLRNPSISVTVNINYRLLRADGVIISNVETLTGQSTGNAAIVKSISPNEGFLLSMELTAPAVSRGQAFVRVFLQRGTNQTNAPLDHLLLQGYVSNDDNLGYPQSPTESSLDGRGWSQNIAISAPGPGNNWTISVPTGVHWKLKAVFMQFQASAAAGNRNVAIDIFSTGVNVVAVTIFPATIAPSGAGVLCAAPGLTALSSSTFQLTGLPEDLILLGGWKIQSQGIAMAAGDTFSQIQITVEEWVGQ